MLIPDFSLQALIPHFKDAGEAFQAFVCDLLKRELPELEGFPALGKDGCIDFCHTDNDCRLVGDCKFMEQGSADTAHREWKKVAAKLREHLASHDGPTKGQAQYWPWFCQDPVISTYFFCININLTNLNQVTALEEVIRQDFVSLADEFSHLDHLRAMHVKVLHWDRFKDRLKAQPFVYFSWFRDSFIPGLEALDTPSQFRGFRAYLGNDKLPYYGIAEHKGVVPASDGSVIPGEHELLNLLESGHEPGIIVTGGGGLGKSRLSLQLARLAKNRDWPVFRVKRIANDTIERLARIVGTTSPALLIFDYVETQDNFAQIIEDMVQINDLSDCRFRFVASCRSSFYKTAVKGRVPHFEVNLAKEDDWLEGYRHAAVRHILAKTGIEQDADHLRVCKGIPVLAVFMAYLRAQGREDELHELIRTEDFGSWVVKRLDAAFGHAAGRDLATLVALFPLPKEAVDRLDRERFDRLLAILAEDGWIEVREWDELHDGLVWGTVHDVLADGVILAYLATVERTADRFVADLLRTAADLGTLRSALTSLQRVVFEAPLRQVGWLELFAQLMAEQPTAWREAREMALQYAGLNPRQQILLLNQSPEIWDGAEGEVPVQNALGWLARWQVNDNNKLTEAEEATLQGWLHKAAGRLTTSNYLLTWGLRLYPETLSGHALEWFRNHPTQFQTHYLLAAWLNKGLPTATIGEWVGRWSVHNAAISHFSFIASAWLNAGGAHDLIEPHVRTWLDVEVNRISAAADFVYKSWLDAILDGEFVQADIRAWLDVTANRNSSKAHFVYKSWLDATKDGTFVQADIRAWLDEKVNRNSAEAGFVYPSWLDATLDGTFVQADIRAWLDVEANRISAEAQFIYKSWLDATKDGTFVQADIRAWLDEKVNRISTAAGFVYHSWLDAKQDGTFVRDDIRAWLDEKENRISAAAQFVYQSWLDATQDGTFVRQAITDWLGHFAEDFKADYVCRAWLEAKGEPEVVKGPAIRWLRLYHEKDEAVFVTKFLAKLPELPNQAVLDILIWCRIHAADPDALWRLTTVARHVTQAETTANDFCHACERLFDHYAAQQHIGDESADQLGVVISHLIGVSLRVTALNNSVDDLFVRWLKHPDSYGKRKSLFDSVQRKSYLQRVVNLLTGHKLDMTSDRDALIRFLQWVNLWTPENKAKIRNTIGYLRHIFPDPDLWDLITY